MTVCELVDANVSSWMPCLQETAFFGEPLLMAFAGFLIMGLIFYKFNIPGELALPLGITYTFALYIMAPSAPLLALLVIGAIGGFAWLALAIKSKFSQ